MWRTASEIMMTSSVMVVVYGGHDIITQRSDLVECRGCLPRCLWGTQRMCFIIPVLFLCVCAFEPGCDWLSARHDVSQLLIREAMKGPPLWNCALCSRLIRKTEILLSLEKKKKNWQNRNSCPRLNCVGLVVEYMQWEKLDKISQMSQRVRLWWNKLIKSGRKRAWYLNRMCVMSLIHCFQ